MTATPAQKNSACIAVISDTHGRLPETIARATGKAKQIIHCGDIDQPAILKRLQQIAPVIAVRGNMDRKAAFPDLPDDQFITIATTTIYIRHDPDRIDLDPRAAGVQIVLHGHTHCPRRERIDDVLYLNPGSACWPRHGYPPSMALLSIQNDCIETRFIDL